MSVAPTASAKAAPTLDAQADQLIARHTEDVCPVATPFLGGSHCPQHVDGQAIGKDIAAQARSSPAEARFLLGKVLARTTDPNERRDIASGLVGALSHDEIRNLAGSTNGRAALEQARNELAAGGALHGRELPQARLDAGLKAADLRNSPAFKSWDPATQNRVLDQIKRQEAQPAAVDQTLALSGSTAFQGASPATRSALLSAQSQQGGDPVFREGLEKLAGSPGFASLTASQQSDAVQALSHWAGSEAYQGKPATLFGGGHPVGETDRRKGLDSVRALATQPGFHRAAPEARQAMLGTLAQHASDPAFAPRLTRLVNEDGFGKLAAPKQAALLRAYGSDNAYAQGLDRLMDPASGVGTLHYATDLNGTQKAQVLSDTMRLKASRSYADAPAADRQALVELMGDSAVFSARNPSDVKVRNALDAVLDGHIKLSLFQEAPSGGGLVWGRADAQGIYLNTHPEVSLAAKPVNAYVDTLAHEVNHKLNGVTAAGTADRFLDEYRAALVGHEAALGRPLHPDEQLRSLMNLIDGGTPAYSHLHALYNSDPKFRAGVDSMRATLQGTPHPASGAPVPPATVSSEEARARLLATGNHSDYLNHPGKVDNEH